MASGKILRQLIKAGAGGDLVAFKAASKSIIDEERQKQHHLLANDLERILYGESKPAPAAFLRIPSSVPISFSYDIACGRPVMRDIMTTILNTLAHSIFRKVRIGNP